MAMQDRSKSLHNFSLPCFKWGCQRVLRCVKLTSDYRPNRSPPPPPPPSSAIKSIAIQKIPVASDPRFNGDAKRLKFSSVVNEDKAGEIDDSSRPWNLRTRRAGCKAPVRIEEKRNWDFPVQVSEIDSPSSVRKKNMEAVEERIKFSVALSKREIEQDFMEMAKIRPPRRPKKRPRIVQKYLDSVFPGLWLTEVTADAYKVPEVPES